MKIRQLFKGFVVLLVYSLLVFAIMFQYSLCETQEEISDFSFQYLLPLCLGGGFLFSFLFGWAVIKITRCDSYKYCLIYAFVFFAVTCFIYFFFGNRSSIIGIIVSESLIGFFIGETIPLVQSIGQKHKFKGQE